MNKSRLEAFSDGVIAVALTIMVLEIPKPDGADFGALLHTFPAMLTYLLSFIYVGIYWNNHHHLMQAVERVNGAVLWANLHVLFWLTLIPFSTAWLSEHHGHAVPTAFYGVILLGAALAYFILSKALIKLHGQHSRIAKAIGRDNKTQLSVILYLTAIILSFVYKPAAIVVYIIVAIIWLIPDRRIEKIID